ncbi:PTS sugar transporter subunit IIC [Erwinia persicina]|uniref:PTS sugar transporter subunit IIC n=1 Tax=Erwinia persicina TaxID=55211 RepID=UPI0017803743|nr:PTS sugar transporter subunit IIC [Erwinia persicina]MBD8162742.1 PTS sugar transporter subunit IIC [Erwinia persicina]MBD8214615.1 PTS sugar transporter subunit IIC [Erwinia persicina]
MSRFSESLFGVIENQISPIAARLSSQRHVVAIKDGFISSMPFLIVGSFMLLFAHPPFGADSQWAFARWWLGMVERHSAQIMMPYNMTMGIMAVYIAAAIAYNLAISYKMNGFMAACLSLMSFLLVAAPQSNGALPVGSLGGEGIFTAIIVSLYSTELMHFLQKRNIGFKLPEQVPPKIRQSFDLLIPILAIFLTLFPLSLLVQDQFGMLLPQAIMAVFKPIISASDSLPAVLIAVLLCHLLWFAGIHGAVIVGGILQAFWLTNLGINQQALNAGEPITQIFIEPFWQFFIVVGGSGSTMGLVFLYLRSRSAHLRSIGKLGLVPSMFNINEPIIFGSPVVMNPLLFIPFITAPLVNAIIAWVATRTDLVNHVVSLAPWTTPGPIGAAWSTGWDFRAVILVGVLIVVSTLIYYPFFKMYERELLKQEKPAPAEAELNAVENR